jgi:hypothetical protein
VPEPETPDEHDEHGSAPAVHPRPGGRELELARRIRGHDGRAVPRRRSPGSSDARRRRDALLEDRRVGRVERVEDRLVERGLFRAERRDPIARRWIAPSNVSTRSTSPAAFARSAVSARPSP